MMPIPFAAIGAVIGECVKPFANPMTWPALGLVAVLGWCQGKDYSDERWRAWLIAERAKQEQALREADERGFRIIDRLNAEKEKRDARIAELLAKLSSDPKYKRACLGPDVVRAINRALSR